MTTEDQKRIIVITLTDRRPVEIIEDEWPVFAEGSWNDHDGQVRGQSIREWSLLIRVRRHSDGRTIVYGVYTFKSEFHGESDFTAKGGYLCAADDDDLPPKISAVGAILSDRMQHAPMTAADGLRHLTAVMDECIGSLPPEVL